MVTITPRSQQTANIAQIHKAKAEKQREKTLKDEMDQRRAKVKAARERRIERKTAKANALTGEEETAQIKET